MLEGEGSRNRMKLVTDEVVAKKPLQLLEK